jgi:hypothetical protein
VLYVVVDRDAAQYREQLRSQNEEYFGPGHLDPLASVRLEVVDRSTDEALERLKPGSRVSVRSCPAVRRSPSPQAQSGLHEMDSVLGADLDNPLHVRPARLSEFFGTTGEEDLEA